jgi:hypothetical protein
MIRSPPSATSIAVGVRISCRSGSAVFWPMPGSATRSVGSNMRCAGWTITVYGKTFVRRATAERRWQPPRDQSYKRAGAATSCPRNVSRRHSAQPVDGQSPGGWKPARRRTGPRPYRRRMMILTRRVRTTTISGRSLCAFIAPSPPRRRQGYSCRRFRLTPHTFNDRSTGRRRQPSGLRPPVPLHAPAPQERGRLSHRR